jgi:rubredoxin
VTNEEVIDVIIAVLDGQQRRKEFNGRREFYAACDTQVCQRCLSTARLEYDEIWCCPRCGSLKHLFEEHSYGRLEVPSGANGGYFPIASKRVTGYYVDDPNGGYRTPARVWVQGDIE